MTSLFESRTYPNATLHFDELSTSDRLRTSRIGTRQKRANTLRESLQNLAASPFDYLRRITRPPTEEEIIWALKDVSFEVKQGEVLGIPSTMLRTSIGRNGASS